MGTAKPRPSPVTVLLGAGASKDAGLPLAAEVTTMLRDRIGRDEDRVLRGLLGLILGSIAFRRGCAGDGVDGPVDIEAVLNAAYLLKNRESHPLAPFVATWHSALERAAPQGQEFVFENLIRLARDVLTDALTTPSDPAAYHYLSGVARLTQPWSSEKPLPARVFTLNYDRCIEAALLDHGVPFTTGFQNGEWNAAEFDREDAIPIWKLHGSLGWMRHPERRTVFDVPTAVARQDMEWASDDVDDDIVFGIEHKLIGLQPYLWMVHRMSECVAAAQCVVVLGYAFGDAYVNRIIGQGMATDPAKHLVVVSPAACETMMKAAHGMTYYPERTRLIASTARDAMEGDGLLKALREIRASRGSEHPF